MLRHPVRLLLGLLVLAAVVVFFLGPYAWIVASSFKPQDAIFRDLRPLSWATFWPQSPTLDNFIHLFTNRGMGRALLNSAIISACQVAFTLILCSLAAYGLTRIRFRGANLVFTLVLMTFLLPIESLMVPLYMTVSGLRLQDTLPGAFIPWIASPFGLFLLRQHFEELPRELDEAARIDGAGHFRIFWSIVLPNVRVALVTLALVTFLFSWNAFLWPLVILSSPRNIVVQLAIAQSVAPGQLPNWGETFAGATIATVPLILLFLFLQRFFVRGVAMSGVKG
ncbi:carbohydrate ABC transporter permease [Roseomonas sp. OT10]|uniref:carbohydrate ABC transporter permease n=1 Tax=Roseomonas cutis TaxID=2897332 RepID=UPI001E2D977C|nr:carbohydrate ABC transporter permease [Roseomonas sp. OT10]UFN48996.1 carbohydrate ABC transporter permease [Roseomonas sp. OT10]